MPWLNACRRLCLMSEGWVMRDQVKEREFFDYGYAEHERFAEFMNGPEYLGSEDPEALVGAQTYWWRYAVFTKAMLDYSCGEPLASWVPRVQGLLREGTQIMTSDHFYAEIWRETSVAALLELTDLQELCDSWVPVLVAPKTRLLGPDVLLDYPGAWDATQSEYTFRFKLHERFREIAAVARSGDVETASDQLTSYVRTHWYRGYQSEAWHGRHLTSRLYSGYWCFEAAALAKQYSLDDSALRDHKYYPWDLAHWARRLTS